MSKTAAEIVKKMHAMTKGENTADVFAATVTAVQTDGSVNVIDLGGYEYNCRTQAINGQTDGLHIKPAIGSVVLVEKVGTDTDKQYCIILFSVVDESSWLIAGYKYLLNGQGHLIASPGNDTLLEVLTLIIEAVEKIIVLKGTNPDRLKLANAKLKAINIFQ